MSALLYIIRKSVKNSFKETLTKPGKLILYLIVIAVIVGVSILSLFTSASMDSTAPLFWLNGFIFLFLAFFLIITFFKGLSGGDAIFDMSDANILFTSPVNPRHILLYGLARMTKTAFFACFFVLFQATSLANFGVGLGGVFLLFLGFLLSMIALMVASLLIYSITNGNAFRKKVCKALIYAMFLPLVIVFALRYTESLDIKTSLEAVIHSPFFTCFPIAGWTSSGFIAFLSGEIFKGLFFWALNIALSIGLMVYIMFSNPDYYEDVLVAAETAYEKKRALAEGNINAVYTAKGSVKTAKTGISGRGSTAIFGKHMRESFRQSRMGFLNTASLFLIAGSIAAAYFIRDMPIVLQILMWMQIFLIGMGKGLKETYCHYIYLIPESSFKKIIWSNMEIVAKTLTESILIFGIGGFILKDNPMLILACIAVYALFTFSLLGINYLFLRFTGAEISAGILVVIYIFAVLLLMAPGIVLAVLTGIAVGESYGLLLGLAVLSAWELLLGLGCFALSKGVLHNCDMPVYKAGK